MKIPITLAIGLYTASSAFAAANNEPETKKSNTPLVAHPIDDYETMAEDTNREPYFPSLKLRDGMSVKWGGRLMFDSTLITAEDAHPSGNDDGVEFRRARIFAEIGISEFISAKVQYDFAGQDVDFNDVYIKFKTEYGGVIVGHHYQPFSLATLTSSKYRPFMETAMVVEALSPGRDSGISTSNKFNDNTRWALGLFRPVGDSGDGKGDGDYSLTGRVTHFMENGSSTFHLGAAASLSGSRDVTRVQSRPEAHQAGRLLDSTAGTSDSNMLLGFEFAWTSGPNTVQAEYLWNSITDFNIGTGAEDVDFGGYYLSYSRFLTGETRPYNKSGKWDRVTPNENWEGKGLSGAWEASARVSSLDLTDGPFDQEAIGLTVGLNWYMNPYSRIMVNVVRSEAEVNGFDRDLTALLARFQVDW